MPDHRMKNHELIKILTGYNREYDVELTTIHGMAMLNIVSFEGRVIKTVMEF